MKYKPLNGYTKQKIIDTIMERNKGERARRGDACSYKTPEGNHCAVGCFMPDEHPGMELRANVERLIEEYPDLEGTLPLGIEALHELQLIHDIDSQGKDPRPALIKWVEENVEG